MADQHLILRDRKQRQEPVSSSAGLELRAEWEWILEGPAEQVAEIHAALSDVSTLMTSGVLLISFGNAVGLVDVPHLGRLNVASGKWSEHHYQHMLAELTIIASGLPFSAQNITALPYDRNAIADDDVLYHMFVYLRHILSAQVPMEQQLLPALRQILHDPQQHFVTTRRQVPLAMAQHVDATTLMQIASGAGGSSPLPPGQHAGRAFASILHGQLPEDIDERQVMHSVDTPENRFVKMMLTTAIGMIERMRETLKRQPKPQAFSHRVLQDCDRMQQALHPIRHHSLWSQVGDLTQLPTTSTVLQGRRGYREVYQHYMKLRLATRLPLNPEQARTLLESKDIALLYEIWSYFSLVQVLSEILGQPADASRASPDSYETQIAWNFRVRWRSGIQLFYNPSFSRSRPNHRRSYSIPLRPDIALEVPSATGTQLHLFDAKFKVDTLESLLPAADKDSDAETEASEERRGIFKRGDLYKMHTYRDAIPAAHSVWILYPGTETRFFSVGDSSFTWGPGYTLPNEFDGVGAIALTPDADTSPALRAILEALLRSRARQA